MNKWQKDNPEQWCKYMIDYNRRNRYKIAKQRKYRKYRAMEKEDLVMLITKTKNKLGCMRKALREMQGDI